MNGKSECHMTPGQGEQRLECGVVNGALVGREEEQSQSVVKDPGVTEGLWASSIASVSTLRTP